MMTMKAGVLLLVMLSITACGVTIKRECGPVDKEGYSPCTTTLHEEEVLCVGQCATRK